jgi:hypothetical protein
VNALFVNEEGGTKTKRPGAFCAESAEDDAASLFEESVGTENNDPRHARPNEIFCARGKRNLDGRLPMTSASGDDRVAVRGAGDRCGRGCGVSAYLERAGNPPWRTYLEGFDGGAFVRAHGRARHRGLHRATRDVRAFPEARAGDGRALRADGGGGGGGEGKGHGVERLKRVLAEAARRGAVCCARDAPDSIDLSGGDAAILPSEKFFPRLTWLRLSVWANTQKRLAR